MPGPEPHAFPVERDLKQWNGNSPANARQNAMTNRGEQTGGHWEASCVASGEGFGDGKTDVSTKVQATSGFAGVTVRIRSHPHGCHGRARGGCLECVPEKTNGVRTQDQDGFSRVVYEQRRRIKAQALGPGSVTCTGSAWLPPLGFCPCCSPRGSDLFPPLLPILQDTTSSGPCQS